MRNGAALIVLSIRAKAQFPLITSGYPQLGQGVALQRSGPKTSEFPTRIGLLLNRRTRNRTRNPDFGPAFGISVQDRTRNRTRIRLVLNRNRDFGPAFGISDLDRTRKAGLCLTAIRISNRNRDCGPAFRTAIGISDPQSDSQSDPQSE